MRRYTVQVTETIVREATIVVHVRDDQDNSDAEAIAREREGSLKWSQPSRTVRFSGHRDEKGGNQW